MRSCSGPKASSQRRGSIAFGSRTGKLYEGRKLVAEDVVRVTVKDTDVSGLELRISGTGARSWAVSKRVAGAQRRFTIPNGARLTLAEARKAAIKLLDDVADGRDPTEERREARKATRMARFGIGRAWTIEGLVDEYGAKVAAPAGQRSWEERRAHVLREFREVAGLPVAEVTDAHLWRVLDAATARGAKVGGWHALRYLRTVLAWALSRKLIDRDPTTELPLKDIRKRMKERARDRVLSPDELSRLWRAFEADAGNVYSAVFRVAGLTAQRLGEVAGMRWADLDLARAEWRQPTNKSDRPHMVPLSADAMAIIQARTQQRASRTCSPRLAAVRWGAGAATSTARAPGTVRRPPWPTGRLTIFAEPLRRSSPS